MFRTDRFSAPVQTGSGAHPASCTMGTRSFSGGKERPRHDADPSPLSGAVVKERVELYLYSPYEMYGLYRALVPVQGCTLPFFLSRYTVPWMSKTFSHVAVTRKKSLNYTMLIKVSAWTNPHVIIYHSSTGPRVCIPLKRVVFLNRRSCFDGMMPHLRSSSKRLNTSFWNEETRQSYKAANKDDT
jgi:hypothetical protein